MKFDVIRVQKLVLAVVREALVSRKYDTHASKSSCKELSQVVLNRVKSDQKDAGVKRYKYVVTASIGSIAEKPGVQFSSRSLWNATTDEFVSVDYSDDTKYAVVVVYAVYFE